jgi:hypothetical protein
MSNTKKYLSEYEKGNDPSNQQLLDEIAVENYDPWYEEEQRLLIEECKRIQYEEDMGWENE